VLVVDVVLHAVVDVVLHVVVDVVLHAVVDEVLLVTADPKKNDVLVVKRLTKNIEKSNFSILRVLSKKER
jgi:hypothetical protein